MAYTQPIVLDDTTNKQGICQHMDLICGTNLVSFPKVDKVRCLNLGLDEVADLVQNYSDTWAWDDSNRANLPIAYADTTAGTMDYEMDTSFVNIRGVYINTNPSDDAWTELDETDKKTVMENTSSATPTHYLLYGNAIWFYPIPSATTTGVSATLKGYGFKLLVERNIVYFKTDGTSAIVGYNPQFTRLATLYGSREYAMSKGLNNLNSILSQIDEMEKRLKASYGRRNKTNTNRLTPISQDNR